jgi:hypothetical protein
MKTQKKIFQACRSNEKIVKITGGSRLLKSMLVILMLAWLTILTSCFFPYGGPGFGGHRGMYGGHRWDHGGYEHGDHSGYGGHH